MKRFIHRHQPAGSTLEVLKAGMCGLVGFAVVALIGWQSGLTWLMVPMGATCVLLFSAPQAPFSQPANVIGGYAVSTAIGLAIAAVAPTEWWSLGLAVGAALVVMQFLRITHPPGAAYPVIILLTRPDWSFLFFPVLTCSVVLVVCAMLLHFLPPRTAYPLSVQTKGG